MGKITYVKHSCSPNNIQMETGSARGLRGAKADGPGAGRVEGCSQSESCLYFFLISSGLADSSMSRISYGLHVCRLEWDV